MAITRRKYKRTRRNMRISKRSSSSKRIRSKRSSSKRSSSKRSRRKRIYKGGVKWATPEWNADDDETEGIVNESIVDIPEFESKSDESSTDPETDPVSMDPPLFDWQKKDTEEPTVNNFWNMDFKKIKDKYLTDEYKKEIINEGDFFTGQGITILLNKTFLKEFHKICKAIKLTYPIDEEFMDEHISRHRQIGEFNFEAPPKRQLENYTYAILDEIEDYYHAKYKNNAEYIKYSQSFDEPLFKYMLFYFILNNDIRLTKVEERYIKMNLTKKRAGVKKSRYWHPMSK